MSVMWKVISAVLAAILVGGYLISSALGDSAPRPDPGPPVVLSESTSTSNSPTLNPPGDDKGDKPRGGKGDKGDKPGRPGQTQTTPDDDDDDDDDLYPEIEDHDDDGDDDDGGDD